jgi:hypothetical protein
MTDAIILVVFLAAAIERVVEAFVGLIEKDDKAKSGLRKGWNSVIEKVRLDSVGVKRLVAIAAGVGIAAALCYGLDFQLFNEFLDEDLSEGKAKLLTALLIGVGAAPAHEFIRYVEEKKKRAEKQATAEPVAAGPPAAPQPEPVVD